VSSYKQKPTLWIRTILFFPLIFTAVIGLLGRPIQAGAENTILALLKSRDAAIKAVLGPDEGSYSAAQKEKLIVLINEKMDFSEMSRTALSAHWEKLGESLRADFVATFSELVRRSSVKKLDIFHAVIEYKKVTVAGEKAQVFTRATYKRTRTNVDYSLHQKNDTWLVTDFSIDEVSTAESYRKSFHRIIRKHGFAGLMERLRKKLAEEGA